jgi:hypothetical protein
MLVSRGTNDSSPQKAVSGKDNVCRAWISDRQASVNRAVPLHNGANKAARSDARQTRRQIDDARPEADAIERLNQRVIAKVALEILDQIFDIVTGQAVARDRVRGLRKALELALQCRLIGQFDIDVEILEKGIGEDLHDIGLRQQAHCDRSIGRAGGDPHCETRDEASRLLSTRRIDVAQEIQCAIAEPRHKGLADWRCQTGDEIGLAGLRCAEHGTAHRPIRGNPQSFGAAGVAAKFAGCSRRILPQNARIGDKPLAAAQG